jgi:hypothetical protein
MLKGGVLDFESRTAAGSYGKGTAVFRTREGFIDTYDAFTVRNMSGSVLKYAGMDNVESGRSNNYGDVSERDFRYIPVAASGSVFFGADDNIMLNYGNSNFTYTQYGGTTPAPYGMGYPGGYSVTTAVSGGAPALHQTSNPYYSTPYQSAITNPYYSTYNVNQSGYLFYRDLSKYTPLRALHRLYRGCKGGDCNPSAGVCKTTSNGARPLTFNFDVVEGSSTPVTSGGLGIVANNYIDLFTAFTFYGGKQNAGMGDVPGMTSLHGENVKGYGLYIKSQFKGTAENYPESRRATCPSCGEVSNYPIGAPMANWNSSTTKLPEMTYIGFHDDARFYPQNQVAYMEAPVIEFFGHAEFNTHKDKTTKTKIALKADSLIFHDSVIFDNTATVMTPFTTAVTERGNDMRYGVINDRGDYTANYADYGKAIEMTDRGYPVIELGYQRCTEPGNTAGMHAAPNIVDNPLVGGDIIVAFKNGYVMPILNTVVANNARISFVTDSFDHVKEGEYWESYIRTDLLRIRNKVEFYTQSASPLVRTGEFSMASIQQMETNTYSGMYTRHLHTEPGSELSLPGENSLIVGLGTVVGGYGTIHENVFVTIGGTVAPGFSSLMEGDCQTPYTQGKLSVHNLKMEENSELRISIGNRNPGGPAMQTDTIEVKDSVYMQEQVPLRVLIETPTLQEGCYLFMTYNDLDGPSSEYVKHLFLLTQRYGNTYFDLDYSTPGEVRLCVTKTVTPVIQRSVRIPEVEGVTITDVKIGGVIQQTNPKAGVYIYYVPSQQTIRFAAQYEGASRKVWAVAEQWVDPVTGAPYKIDLDLTAKSLGNNTFEYTLSQVTQEWRIVFGDEGTSNLGMPSQKVWAYRNTLYINVPKEDVVSVYNVTGVLNKRLTVSEGLNSMTLQRGVYLVSLKDGTVYKIVVQ